MTKSKNKSDKQVILQAILPFCLFQLTQGGMKGKVNEIEALSQALIIELIGNKDKAKMLRRLDRKAHEIYLVMRNAKDDTVSGHKAVLTFYSVAQKMIDNDFKFDSRVVDLIDLFLKLEGQQDVDYLGNPISDEDWLALKASADKAAEKIYKIIKNI